MATTEQVNTTVSEPVANTVITPVTGCGDDVSGGFNINEFSVRNGPMLFWVSVIFGLIILLVIILFIIGTIEFAKDPVVSVTGASGSKFVPKQMLGQSNFGNYPNWYMQDGCAGYNCSVDTGSGKSLGFGVSDFDNKKSQFGPLPGVRQNMAVGSDQQKQAAADLLAKSNMAAQQRQEHLLTHHRQFMTPSPQPQPQVPPPQVHPQPQIPTNSNLYPQPVNQPQVDHMRLPKQQVVSHMAPRQEKMDAAAPTDANANEQAARAYIAARTLDEVGGRQARTLAGCNNPWDPMATEEAKVLGAVGVFKPNTPGMSSFSRAINDNIPLTDAQLEAIMQGGEPYTIAPVSTHDQDALAAQRRQQTIMDPQRSFT